MSNVIKEFYQAFSELDAERMVACYHDDVWFCRSSIWSAKGESAPTICGACLSNPKRERNSQLPPRTLCATDKLVQPLGRRIITLVLRPGQCTTSSTQNLRSKIQKSYRISMSSMCIVGQLKPWVFREG